MSDESRRRAAEALAKLDVGHHYDLDGQPMSALEWAFEMGQREIGRGIVGQTHLPNGYFVSTVWLGLDHSFGRGRPLIFESMVFLSWGDGRDLEQIRYASEAEAKAGHQQLVHRWLMKKRRKSGIRT